MIFGTLFGPLARVSVVALGLALVLPAPSSDTFQAAAAYADWKNAPGFYQIITDSPGKNSWPIAATSFILLLLTAPVGTEVQEPSPVATVKTQVLDSGKAHLKEWVQHRVNIYKDYQRRFGKVPGKVLGISIQTNSNHTDSLCDGMIGDIAAKRD